MAIKNLLKKYVEISLIKRILVGLVIGVILALTIPGNSVISLFGDLFVAGLKGVAPVLVFFLVISALCRAKAVGNMKMILVLYVASTLIAAIAAVIASYVFPTAVTLVTADAVTQTSPAGIGEVLTTLLLNIFCNPVNAILNANYIGILAWGVVLGIALRVASENVKDVFGAVSDAVSKVVRWVIELAPFGIMGLVYVAVSTNGLTNPLLVFAVTKKNPYPLVLRCLKDSGLTAFFTRSSAANIPVNMSLCAKLGLNKDAYSVSIPLGATINMAGAAITITVMTMAAAHTLGVSVDPITAVLLCVMAAVSACGASGVAGGSLLLIPLCCSLFGIGNDIAMQVVAIGFIIGVIQDSCETALNSSSDVLFTAAVDYAGQIKEGKEVNMGKDVQ